MEGKRSKKCEKHNSNQYKCNTSLSSFFFFFFYILLSLYLGDKRAK